MGTIVSDPMPVTAAFDVAVGALLDEVWKEITISLVDSNGDPVTGSGTLSVAARPAGSDQFADFSNSLDLAAGERSFSPFSSRVDTFRFTPASINAGTFIIATINTWRQ